VKFTDLDILFKSFIDPNSPIALICETLSVLGGSWSRGIGTFFFRVTLSSQCNKVHVGMRLTSGVPCKVPYSGGDYCARDRN